MNHINMELIVEGIKGVVKIERRDGIEHSRTLPRGPSDKRRSRTFPGEISSAPRIAPNAARAERKGTIRRAKLDALSAPLAIMGK